MCIDAHQRVIGCQIGFTLGGIDNQRLRSIRPFSKAWESCTTKTEDPCLDRSVFKCVGIEWPDKWFEITLVLSIHSAQ